MWGILVSLLVVICAVMLYAVLVVASRFDDMMEELHETERDKPGPDSQDLDE